MRYERESVAEMPGKLLRTCKMALWSGGSSKSSEPSDSLPLAPALFSKACEWACCCALICPPTPSTEEMDWPTLWLWLDCWTMLRFFTYCEPTTLTSSLDI